jgi:phosphatidylserine decarboxylase
LEPSERLARSHREIAPPANRGALRTSAHSASAAASTRGVGETGRGSAHDQVRKGPGYRRGVNDAWIVTALSLVPKRPTARGMGMFARLRLPAFAQRALLNWYVGKYGVDLSECEGTLADYDSLSTFFVRALREGVRPVDPAPEAIVSPVDGRAYAVGTVTGGRIPQAPGKDYAVAELLGIEDATSLEGAPFAVLYLSPRDYHRVHTPREGSVVRWSYLPGALWPVFPAATAAVPSLFARNERWVTTMGTDLGEVTVVMVGAFGVGRMRVVYSDRVTNDGGSAGSGSVQPPVPLGRAAELGRFELGSTVILIFQPGSIAWSVRDGDPVRVGSRIGSRL